MSPFLVCFRVQFNCKQGNNATQCKRFWDSLNYFSWCSWASQSYNTGKTHPCLGGHHREGTPVRSEAPVWHRSMPSKFSETQRKTHVSTYFRVGDRWLKVLGIFCLSTHLAVRSLVKHRVWATIFLLEIVNEGHDISNGVGHTAAWIWPDEPQGESGNSNKSHCWCSCFIHSLRS